MSNLTAGLIVIAAVLILVLAAANAIDKQADIDAQNLDKAIPPAQRAEIVGVTK